jgi:hypothetical protein
VCVQLRIDDETLADTLADTLAETLADTLADTLGDWIDYQYLLIMSNFPSGVTFHLGPLTAESYGLAD